MNEPRAICEAVAVLGQARIAGRRNEPTGLSASMLHCGDIHLLKSGRFGHAKQSERKVSDNADGIIEI
jgi:hypothetical protein